MSGKTRRRRKTDSKESQLSELHLATVYGIEGLARYGEDFEEQWLDLFQTALNELDKPVRPEPGGFKLSSSGEDNLTSKEYLIPDSDDRREVVEGLEELSTFSRRLKEEGVETEGGQISQEELEEKIDLAKEIRDKFKDLKAE